MSDAGGASGSADDAGALAGLGVPAGTAMSDEQRAMSIEVVRSQRRRKTVQAREENGVVRVSIPASMTRAEEEHWVAVMVDRFSRRADATAIDLTARAATLAQRYHLPVPREIRWVDNQRTLWGSCTPTDGSVRISSVVAGYPAWVLDYVIVHELAHLVVHGHGRAFWDLVNRYPKTERARGYLMAKETPSAP